MRSSLDLPSLFEVLVDVSDRGRSLLEANEIGDDAAPLLRELISRIDATIDILEDVLDLQERADAEQTGSISWSEAKMRLGLLPTEGQR